MVASKHRVSSVCAHRSVRARRLAFRISAPNYPRCPFTFSHRHWLARSWRNTRPGYRNDQQRQQTCPNLLGLTRRTPLGWWTTAAKLPSSRRGMTDVGQIAHRDQAVRERSSQSNPRQRCSPTVAHIAQVLPVRTRLVCTSVSTAWTDCDEDNERAK